MAAGIPSTSRFGITLVNSEPGPSVIRSALRDGVQRSAIGRHLAGVQANAADARRLWLMRVSPATSVPSSRVGFQRHVGGGGGIDPAADVEHFGGLAHGILEVAHDVGEGGQEEIAEAVPVETAARLETILEQARHQAGVLGKGHHAVADVARAADVEVAPQPAGTAAIVGDGDDGGDVDMGARPADWRSVSSRAAAWKGPCLRRGLPPGADHAWVRFRRVEATASREISRNGICPSGEFRFFVEQLVEHGVLDNRVEILVLSGDEPVLGLQIDGTLQVLIASLKIATQTAT